MRYDNYADLNLSWIHTIPFHWQIAKNRQLLHETNCKTETGNEDLLMVSQYTGISRKEQAYSNIGMRLAESQVGYKLVHVDDIVMNIMLAWNGSTGASKYNGIVSPAYSVFRCHECVNPWYIHYLFRTPALTKFFKANSTGIIESRLRLYPDVLLRLYSIVPPRAEQDQIVRYLDWQVSKINKLIAAKKTELDLLQEQEQAILDRVVTRGLHLGKSMRYSGINWIAEIPFDWETIKIRRFCTLQNGISESEDFFTKGTPFVSYGDVYKHIILPGQVSGVANSTIEQQDTFSVKKGDVFFTRTSETINEVGMPTVCLTTIDKAVFSGFLIRVRPFKSLLSPHYLKHYLRYSGIQLYFARTMNIVIRASLGQNLLKELTVLVPPKNEQILIAEYLDASHEQFENIRQKIHKEIDVLHELRTRLISDVVTGQIDVRNVNVPDFEMVEETISDESADEDDISEEAEEQEE